ncbi:hypothetical protein ACFO3O_08970 [Dokdonia ponticola]|uniref:Uncharacterized protein n=1 Tax=Dokdonia ponticola TaxID=2041041 RepID=A0ABV9HV44_9FLAO
MEQPNYINTILVLLTFVVFSCKTESSKEVELIYEVGNQKIVVEIENGQNFLEYNTPTKTNFILTNIDPHTLLINGAGIRVLGTKNKTTMRTEINVPNNYLENDTLNIKVWFNKEKKSHEFNIPLKSAEQNN